MAAASSSEAATATATTRTTVGGSALPGPPPPTPSNHHAAPPASGATDNASLSAFLHRLLLSSPAPQLRSPLAARSRASPPSLPPLVSLESPDQRALRAAADVGYFHLAGHGVPPALPSSALAELSRIDASTRLETNLRALGFSEEEEEGEEQDVNGGDPAVVFDAACEADMDALPAAAEYARRMRDVGMRVVALLAGCPDTGFREEPFAEEGRRKARCLVWASWVSAADGAAPPALGKAKAYPYVVALHCQWEASGPEEAPPSWVMNNAGEWTAVGARDGAILVTLGDIAQVWSNGKLNKVRGMARPTSAAPRETQHGETDRLSLTVLITLSLDNVISPLVPLSNAPGEGREDEANGAGADDEDGWRFHSFLLEDYAWRVYNQRLQFKDPLVRYRI